MQKKFRKLLSLVLACAMMLSMTTTVFATEGGATAYVENNVSKITGQYIINDEVFDISFSQDGNVRTAVIDENQGKTITVLQIDDKTGIMTYNGVPIREEVTRVNAPSERNLIRAPKSNWTEPTEEVTSVSLVSFTVAGIVGYLQLKYAIMPDKAAYIASLIISAGGFR